MQATPVAASTLSFFLLSLDRYATVKHPRLAQLRQRRYLHVSLAIFSWMTSALVSVPFLFVYKIVARTVVIKNATHRTTATTTTPATIAPIISTITPIITTATTTLSSSSSSHFLASAMSNNATAAAALAATTAATTSANVDFPNVSISCHSDPGANPAFVVFILIHTFVVFILPGLGVLLNHYGVRRKLCALSLTARAAHGELPLPMPILRRQTHMVIVTGIAAGHAHQAAGCGAGTTQDDTSHCGGIGGCAGSTGCIAGGGAAGGDIQMHNLNPRSAITNRSYIKTKNPISPR